MKALFVSLCLSSIAWSSIPNDVDEHTEVVLLEESQLDDLIQQTSTMEKPKSPAPIAKPPHKNHFLAVGLSALLPGLGHVYLEDPLTAVKIFATSGVALRDVESSNELTLDHLLIFQQNTWFYGIYAAYRDMRAFNRQLGYHYTAPNDSFYDLSMAPITLTIIKKPEVWGGVLGLLTLGLGAIYLTHSHDVSADRNIAFQKNPLFAFPIGIGEEAFFRGYLQSSLSETFTPLGGIILSTALFTAAHIPNANFFETKEQRLSYYTISLPLITTIGSYLGWLAYKNQSLKESVAVHVWYDFVLFLIGSIAPETPSAAIQKPRFSTSFSF